MYMGGGCATIGFFLAVFEIFVVVLYAIWKSPTLSWLVIILGMSG